MSLNQRLADAARCVAERVEPPEVDLDLLRSRAHTNQRRTVALAVATALVVLALIGVPLLGAGRATTAPQPAESPRSHIVQTLRDSRCSGDRCLKPGTYNIFLGPDTSGHTWRARVTVPGAGWDSEGDLHRVSRANGVGAVVLNVYQPHAIAGRQPCTADVLRKVAPDATTDDVVRLLTTLPQFAVVDGPGAVPAFGVDTRHLRVRTDRVSCPPDPGSQYNLADIYGGSGQEPLGDSDIDPDQPVLIDFWVLEIAGKPVMVEARQEGAPGAELVQQLDQLRRSITFGIRQ